MDEEADEPEVKRGTWSASPGTGTARPVVSKIKARTRAIIARRAIARSRQLMV
jgi:hypothetical protein